jgi:hypothetical protein
MHLLGNHRVAQHARKQLHPPSAYWLLLPPLPAAKVLVLLARLPLRPFQHWDVNFWHVTFVVSIGMRC